MSVPTGPHSGPAGDTAAERAEAIASSFVTAEQYEQLPKWYRDGALVRAEAHVAQREGGQGARSQAS